MWNLKYLGQLFALLAISSCLFWSCAQDETVEVKVGNPAAFAASKTSLVLNQKEAKNNAIAFTWSPGTNYGTNAAIDYVLQFAKKGTDFASPVEVEAGRAIYTSNFKTEEFNDLLLKDLLLAPEVESTIEVRLKSVVAAESIPADISNVTEISVKPYKPVSKTLYMVGDATANGWDGNAATELIADEKIPTTFTYNGSLKAGEFKFITTLGQFLPSYQKGDNNTKLVLRTSDDQPDDKFVIEQAGVYAIKLDLVDLSIEITKMDQAPYSRLWIVGDATPNGWDIDAPNEMVQNAGDPFIFKFNGILKAGEFKIPTSTGNWGADFYMPTTNHPEITATSVQLVPGGSPDNKWQITTAGAYKITLNLRDMTISIKPFTPYEKLWIVGDSTPNGWNIDAPNEMVKDANNPYVFTYTAELKAGEFKIPTATGDWGTDFFMPAVNNPEITDTQAAFIPGGSPDNKWRITTPGTYKITLNQLYETISIEKQ